MTLLELYTLAEKQNIEVDSFPLGAREALCVQDAAGQCHIAIDPHQLEGTADEKTKLGHELGHCMTGAFYNPLSSAEIRRQQENRAEKWEIRNLISEEALREAVAAGKTDVWELAEYFEVTEELMRKAICLYQRGNLAIEMY